MEEEHGHGFLTMLATLWKKNMVIVVFYNVGHSVKEEHDPGVVFFCFLVFLKKKKFLQCWPLCARRTWSWFSDNVGHSVEEEHDQGFLTMLYTLWKKNMIMVF